MAKLLREREFTTQFHEGENAQHPHSVVDNRVILVVIFDKKTSLGLVRLSVKKATRAAQRESPAACREGTGQGQTPFAEITDDDIDNLFNELNGPRAVLHQYTVPRNQLQVVTRTGLGGKTATCIIYNKTNPVLAAR